MQLIFIAISLVFLIPAFLPLEVIFENIPDIKGKMVPLAWVYGILATTLASILFTLLLRKANFEQRIKWLNNFFNKYCLYIAFGIATSSLLIFSRFVFNYRPHLVDSVVQVFQAKLFVAGNFSAELSNLLQFFYTTNLVLVNGEISSQYPPLHSLILSLGVLLNLTWLVPVLISLLAIFFANKFYQEILSERETILATLLLAICPFFLFLGASFMNHVSTFMFIAAFAWLAVKYYKDPQSHRLIFAACFAAAAFITRPLTAIAVGLCFLFFLAPTLKNRFKDVIFAGFATSPLIALYLYFNFKTTGNFLTPGYIALWGEKHGLGFHETPYGTYYGVYEAFKNFLVNLSFLNEFFFEALVPSLLFLPILFLSKENKNWDNKLLILAFSLPCAYFFYWHRDSFLGPRFIFVSILFLIPLLVRSYLALEKLIANRSTKFNYLLFLRSFIAICLIYSLTLGISQRFLIYSTSLQSFKFNIKELLEEKKIDDAIIFVPVSWGNRMIATLRASGLPAWTTEATYRSVDHCKLWQVVKEYKTNKHDYAWLEKEIARLRALNEKVTKVNLVGDPTVRLSSAELSTDCIDEINYDKNGFSNFSPFLNDNSVDFDGDIIIARDLRADNQLLINKFPDKKVYYLRDYMLSH